MERALSVLIASTRRTKRQLDLLAVSEELEIARQGLGSLPAVGERIGLSGEMLRQFASVASLSENVKELVRGRGIDSVDVAHRLSKLRPADQAAVANAFVAGELDSDDVRAVVTLRKGLQDARIGVVIGRVKESRNIREYVIQVRVPPGVSESRLRRRFAAVTGASNIRSIDMQGDTANVVVNREGKRHLQEEAKAHGVTRRGIAKRIAEGETE